MTSTETAAEFRRRRDDLRAGGVAIPMRHVFALATESSSMQPSPVEVLLETPDHASRVGAVSIMDFQARSRTTSESRRCVMWYPQPDSNR